MECLVKDGRDAITINGFNKYCYEHYQIYDSMQNLFREISKTQSSLSWKDYLKEILDTNNKESWKISLVDSTTGKTLDIVASVVKAELNQIQS